MNAPGIPRVATRWASVATDDRPLRLGVFGAGKAARFHLEALTHLHGVEITGVCTRSRGTAAELLAGHGPGLATDRPEELLGAGLDAVLVAVPTSASGGIVGAALEAGVAVLAEKPLAPSSTEALALAETARRTGTLGMVAVNRRYYSLVLQALAVVRSRGPVRGVMVEAHEPLGSLVRQGNIDAAAASQWFLLNSVHFIDLLRLVGGEPTSVTVQRNDRSAPSRHLSASLAYAGGSVGTFVAHWDSSAPPMLRIYGDDVSAEVTLAPPEDCFVRFAGKRRVRLKTDAADRLAKPGVLDQDAAFLSAVSRGRGSVPFPASDLADHAETIRLTEVIFAGGCVDRPYVSAKVAGNLRWASTT